MPKGDRSERIQVCSRVLGLGQSLSFMLSAVWSSEGFSAGDGSVGVRSVCLPWGG